MSQSDGLVFDKGRDPITPPAHADLALEDLNNRYPYVPTGLGYGIIDTVSCPCEIAT